MLLYVHIPFCDSKCNYCSFNSYVDKFHLKQAYMQAILKQLQHEIIKYKVKLNSIQTLFIGGGTPSTISADLYKPIFSFVQPYLLKNAEITTEANPNSASYQWLNDMKNLGINRISFGVQSFNDKKLKFLNRAHSGQDAVTTVKNASHVGIKNISIDIIYATSQDTKELLQDDLKQAFSLPINHISAYALTIEAKTPFAKTPHVAKEKSSLTNFIFKNIQQNGFEQYEISNFGTYKSLHNLGYWQYKNYLGIGSGAVGSVNGVRYYPLSDIELYIKKPLHVRVEKLTLNEQKDEKILLGFRSIVGVDINIFTKKELKRVQILLKENKLEQKDGKLYNLDYLLSDEIALFIMA